MATTWTDADPLAFIAAVTPAGRQRDARVLLDLMREATGLEPRMFGSSIIGFGEYAYEYASGRKGTAVAAGFSPRKAATVVYLLDGIGNHEDALAKLGPHTTGVGCLHIKDLSKTDLRVLKAIVRKSFKTLTAGVFGQRAREAASANTADAKLLQLFATIANGNDASALRSLADGAGLATTALSTGATRERPDGFFFDAIRHGVYTGDTALHVAAAAYRIAVVEKLLDLGANANAKNRRGAEPLHYAVDGIPGTPSWDPKGQARVIKRLLEAGADPNTNDKNGVTPLHRAVRNRCAGAVRVLLEGGADARRKNKNGSTPMVLAMQTTGRGGSGSAEAKEQQALIVALLKKHR